MNLLIGPMIKNLMNPLKVENSIQKQECRLILLVNQFIIAPTMKYKTTLPLNNLKI